MSGLVVVLGLLAASAAFAGCPDNWITPPGGDVGYMVSTASASYEGGEGFVPWQAGSPCPFVCYDLPHGRLDISNGSWLYGHSTSFVRTEDEFTLNGPGSSPVPFEVVLVLDAEIDVEGIANAALERGAEERILSVTASGRYEASIAQSIVPGVPFTVGARAFAEGGRLQGSGRAIVTVRFRGLPDGYGLSSCRGYDLPTPAHAASWGGVKALYR